jgi:hypothetical protein
MRPGNFMEDTDPYQGQRRNGAMPGASRDRCWRKTNDHKTDRKPDLSPHWFAGLFDFPVVVARNRGWRKNSKRPASDPELVSAAQSLFKLIRALPQGEKHIQFAKGSGIAQADAQR